MAMPGPVLVEAVVDPFEPPMPSKVTRDQAMNMAQALARGEPHRGRIAQTLFRDKMTDLLAPTPSDGPVNTVKEKLRDLIDGDSQDRG
jgi:hypothetical protein